MGVAVMSVDVKAKTDAWMPLWIGAYLADTMRLTTTQHGGYLLLLMAYWRDREPLPDDDHLLRSITKTDKAEWKKMRPVLEKFFKVADGVWWHKRVEEELAVAGSRQAQAHAKAKAAADARWNKSKMDAPSNATSMPQAYAQALLEECPTPSPTHSSSNSTVISKEQCVGISAPTHTISETFRAEIRTTRPELDPDIVWAVFVQKTKPRDQTMAVWKAWIARERAPVAPALNPQDPALDPDTRAGVEAMAKAKGLQPWDGVSEQWQVYKARIRAAPKASVEKTEPPGRAAWTLRNPLNAKVHTQGAANVAK
jgi:uncharacterized protein YdaU (DUF1376 family)